jgi:hypothetical protein
VVSATPKFMKEKLIEEAAMIPTNIPITPKIIEA